MAATILYLTELLGLRVFDLKGRVIGRLKEAAIVPLVDPVRVDRFLVGAGDTWFTIRYDQVKAISLSGVELHDEQLTPYHSDEYMLRLVRDLMDQQIIDAHGRKVVRVTDVTFDIRPKGNYTGLFVQEVDIGLRSIFRRLFQGVLPRQWIRKLQGPIAPRSIPWEYCNIIEPDPMRRLRLNITPESLQKIHPADLAEIVEELGPEGREAVLTTLDRESAAETISELDPDVQASVLESMEAEQAAGIIEEMSPDEAADALQELARETSDEILEEMEGEPKSEVRELLEYEENTAGGLMNTEYVAMPESATIADAVRGVSENVDVLDGADCIFLIDGSERLSGMVPLARLLTAGKDVSLATLKSEALLQAVVDDSSERVIEMFDKYNVLTLPVVDGEGRLSGVITADDIISLLRWRQ